MKKIIKAFLILTLCIVCCPAMVQAKSRTADMKLDQAKIAAAYDDIGECKDYFTIMLKLVYGEYYNNKEDYSAYVVSQIEEQYKRCLNYVNQAESVDDLLQEISLNGMIYYMASDEFALEYDVFDSLLEYDLTLMKSEADLPRLKILLTSDSETSYYISDMNEYYQELYMRDYRICLNKINNATSLIDTLRGLYEMELISPEDFTDTYEDIYPLADWEDINVNLIFSNDALIYLENLGKAKMDAYIYSQSDKNQKSCQAIEEKTMASLDSYLKADEIFDAVNDAIDAMMKLTGKKYTLLSQRASLNYVNQMKDFLKTYNNGDYGSHYSLLTDDYCNFVGNCLYEEDAKYIIKMVKEYFSDQKTLDDMKKEQIASFKENYSGNNYDQTKVKNILSELEKAYKDVYTSADFDSVTVDYESKLMEAYKVLAIQTINGNSKYGSVTKTQSVVFGENGNVVANAKKGYAIKAILVDGKKKKITNYQKMTITFKDVEKSHIVKVLFEKKVLYKVKTITSKHGSITKSTSVRRGDSCTIKIRPAAGYKIASIKVDGKKHKLVNRIKLKNIKKNHRIKVVFTK